MESRLSAASRESLLAGAFHGSSQGLALAGFDDDRIVEANDAFLAFLGRSSGDVVGSTIRQLGLWSRLGDDRARAQLRERGVVEAFDTSVRTSDGGSRAVRLWAEVVEISDERYVALHTSDVEGRISTGSRYQELREAEVRFRTLLEQIPAITYTQVADETSPTGFRDIYISPQTLPVLGYTAQEWQADSELWIKATHPEDRDHVIDADQTASRSGERFLDEYRMIARDGRVVWFRDEAVYVEDPVTGLGFWQGVMLDITEQKRAERERADTESKYQALVERIPALIYTEVTDESRSSGSRAVFVGPFSEGLLGYTSEELVNDPQLWDLIVHPDDRGRIFEFAQKAEAHGRPFSHEYRVVRKDGEIRWVHDEATLIDEPKNGLLIWQGFMLDITERKDAEEKLRQAELRYRSLVEHLPAVVYIDAIDDLSTAVYVSPQYERLLGYTAEERMGDPGLWLRQIHPADREWVLAESKRTNRTGDPFAVEYRMIARDGRVVWVQDEAEVIRDETGAPLYWQGVLLDISERKHAEQGLAKALEQLRSLDRLKNTLLHTLSHDLKGPLTAILGAASTLERLDRSLSEDERNQILQTLADRTRDMNKLLTDLLDLDRLDQGILEPRRFPVDLAELVRDAVARTEALAERRVDLEAPRTSLNVDKAWIERILDNLLANAARHTPATARIWIRVGPYETGALLQVDDDGPGVPDDLKEAIFEPFRRGSSAESASGSGIGLSLVARFAELHGGRAWVEDRPGGGASFRVFLPDVPTNVN